MRRTFRTLLHFRRRRRIHVIWLAAAALLVTPVPAMAGAATDSGSATSTQVVPPSVLRP